MKLTVNGKINKITLKNVLFILEFEFQLISVRVLDKLGFKTQHSNNRVLIKKQGIIAATRSLSSTNLYTLDVLSNPVAVDQALAASLQTWHHLLAHVNTPGLKQMVSNNVVKGVHIATDTIDISKCSCCIL